MDQEFRFHLEMETERLMREKGLDAVEARRRAHVAFGGVDKHREDMRGIAAAVMGVLLPASQAPAGQLPYTDGALVNATIAYTPEGAITADERLRLFRPMFPYLEVPLSGSPNPVHAKAE